MFTPEFTGRAAIGVDGDHGRRLARRAQAAGLDVRTFAVGAGADGDADVTVTDVALGPDSSSFTIVEGGERAPVRTALVGAFNVTNVLAAFATARLAGFGVDAILAGLAEPISVPGRMERVEAGEPFFVFVDYAHTPDALAAVLAAARPFVATGGRLLVVFGCGGDRDRAKRPVMGAVASRLSDIAYLTSDNPRPEPGSHRTGGPRESRGRRTASVVEPTGG